ncbi:MAG TPA: AAA family ATPase [Solirubrobacteraceae bacterium]|nr:AAA family ATPase [Solirubrobacteraceae bacterium]
MHLKRISIRGFKSFRDRTALELGPGVSVIVGPNGSGKSNITDAILWALGEQSPSVVRSKAMEDVIFAGGSGVPASAAAEVELVLANEEDALALPFGEVAIARRLGSDGEGEYLLNGARCRRAEILELLSDAGLGKEAHSVVSQGRIEAVVSARPAQRRALIEEAAGLAKHRARRASAQRKLERTRENLARALDVEREARSSLRPLERQARAAELHERLARQMAEVRLALVGERYSAALAERDRTRAQAQRAHSERAQLEQRLSAVMERRQRAEEALAERSARSEQATALLYELRSAFERLQGRAEQTRALGASVTERLADARAQAAELRSLPERSVAQRQAASSRIEELQAALERAEQERTLALAKRTEEHERALQSAREARSQAQAVLVGLRERAQQAQRALSAERAGVLWERSWEEVRELLRDGVEELVAIADAAQRATALDALLVRAQEVARTALQSALGAVDAAEREAERAGAQLLAGERALAAASEAEQRAAWLIERERTAAAHGEQALRVAAISGELAAERRALERAQEEAQRSAARLAELEEQIARLQALPDLISAGADALGDLVAAGSGHLQRAQAALEREREAGAGLAGQLRACASEEAELQGRLHQASEALTSCRLESGRAEDRAAELHRELGALCAELGRDLTQLQEQDLSLAEDERAGLQTRLQRLERRREALGPVNPLAQEEHAQALAHVQELQRQREDTESALRELEQVIREADRRIRETFQQTFRQVAESFEAVIGEVFPGGSGHLELVEEAPAREALPEEEGGEQPALSGEDDPTLQEEGVEAGEPAQSGRERRLGVEIEVRPAGKSSKRLSLLSGGEKSMTALAFLFAIFLARPCPFYVLDEVEAALDDVNLERFVALLRRCAGEAQFIVITHQKRTMEAADWLFGVSIGRDGVSKVLSRRMTEPLEPALPGTA